MLLLGISCTNDRDIKLEDPIIIDPDSELIHYWNFNEEPADVTVVLPTFSILDNSTAQIEYTGTDGGIMDIDTDGYNTNVQNGDSPGNLLKTRNPSTAKSLIFDLPTTGYKKIVLRFATGRSNNGALVQNYSYTIDGTTYTNEGLSKISHNPNPDPTPPNPNVDLIVLDFSEITDIDNNPNFKVKIEFGGDTAAGATGNNRFDNVTLSGIPLSEPPSGLTYSSSNTFTVNTAITTLAPTVNVVVDSYSILPALPNGLSLNETTGAISGTPIAAGPAAIYTITAKNTFGSTTATLTIAIITDIVDSNIYLIQYWNFNDLLAGEITAPVAPIASLTSPNTSSIFYIGTGGILDSVDPGNLINTQYGDTEGFGLRARNPSSAKELLIKAPSTGYKNIVMKFATAKSSASGASIQNYTYSLDGINFKTTGLGVTTFNPNIEPTYGMVTLDFSGITGANNNANFTVKISFAGPEALNTTGNNRFDNFTLQGNIL